MEEWSAGVPRCPQALSPRQGQELSPKGRSLTEELCNTGKAAAENTEDEARKHISPKYFMFLPV